MHHVLRELLEQTGVPESTLKDWANVMMLRNFGLIPDAAGTPNYSSLKGFKLLLLRRGGRPTFFVRCASADDEIFRRECAVISRLSHHPELARMIPRTTSAELAGLRIQVMHFVSGRSFEQIGWSMSPSSWERAAFEILDNAERISSTASVLLRDLFGPRQVVALADAMAARIAFLERQGFLTSHTTAIRAALEAVVPLPRRLQHGDLWPGNIIRANNAWWYLDFAEFGLIDVPLCDVWHLLRHAPRTSNRRWNSACTNALERQARRLGLSDVQVAGTRLCYLIFAATHRLRHGVAGAFAEAFVRELMLGASALDAGTDIVHVFRPDGPSP